MKLSPKIYQFLDKLSQYKGKFNWITEKNKDNSERIRGYVFDTDLYCPLSAVALFDKNVDCSTTCFLKAGAALRLSLKDINTIVDSADGYGPSFSKTLRNRLEEILL